MDVDFVLSMQQFYKDCYPFQTSCQVEMLCYLAERIYFQLGLESAGYPAEKELGWVRDMKEEDNDYSKSDEDTIDDTEPSEEAEVDRWFSYT